MKKNRTAVHGLLVMAAATAIAVGISQEPAAAAVPAASADRVEQAVAQHRADSTGTVSGSASVTVDRSKPSVTLSAAAGSVQISLDGSASATPRSQGTAHMYDGVAPATSEAIYAASGSAQMLAMMLDSTAPTTQNYRLGLPAGTRVVREGAGFSIVSAGRVIGTIDAPWAVDANGRKLPTSYTLNGTILSQHTDTTGATYPVVADPRITIGLGVYFNAWGYEVKAYYATILATSALTIAFTCTQTGRLPFPLNGIAAIMCAYVGASIVKHVLQAIVDVVQGETINDGSCYQIKLVTDDHFKRVPLSNCG
jgi:hypothetical protein